MHSCGTLGFVEVVTEDLEQPLRFRRGLCQSSDLVELDPGDEFRIAEGLEVTSVAQELCRVVQKVGDVFLRDSSIRAQLLPVSC